MLTIGIDPGLSGAAIAVRMLGPLKEEARKRQEATGKEAPRDASGHFAPVPTDVLEPGKGEAAVHAAELVGIGVTSVRHAKVVSETDASLDKARLLFPTAELHLAKHDGRAEALLLAYWAQNRRAAA